MIDTLLQLIAPHSCCGCGYHGSLLCQVCKYDITTEPFSNCFVCLRPTAHDNICEVCRAREPYTGGWCVGLRSGSLKVLLDRYKFDSTRRAGVDAATLLEERLPVLPAAICVVPVPTTPAHRRVRGFDHTQLIAKRFARQRGLVYASILSRTDTGAQHFRSRAERLKAARQGLNVRHESPEVVLLIDDIYTTGATLRACADVLRENGAKEVFVAIIARQPLDDHNDL